MFWDQIRGTEPRYCTTELIRIVRPSVASSDTICSVSTSLATLPLLFTPRFKYLHQKIEKLSDRNLGISNVKQKDVARFNYLTKKVRCSHLHTWFQHKDENV